MPKTKKRNENRREARITKAHATELPRLQMKGGSSRRSSGHKAPTRGIARYPWAISIIVLLIAIGILWMYVTHTWLFAPR
jgi:peptidylprolyl isomerase